MINHTAIDLNHACIASQCQPYLQNSIYTHLLYTCTDIIYTHLLKQINYDWQLLHNFYDLSCNRCNIQTRNKRHGCSTNGSVLNCPLLTEYLTPLNVFCRGASSLLYLKRDPHCFLSISCSNTHPPRSHLSQSL